MGLNSPFFNVMASMWETTNQDYLSFSLNTCWLIARDNGFTATQTAPSNGNYSTFLEVELSKCHAENNCILLNVAVSLVIWEHTIPCCWTKAWEFSTICHRAKQKMHWKLATKQLFVNISCSGLRGNVLNYILMFFWQFLVFMTSPEGHVFNHNYSHLDSSTEHSHADSLCLHCWRARSASKDCRFVFSCKAQLDVYYR